MQVANSGIDVSVVMPAFNVAAYLSEAISSVIAQTHDNWELLVVDDCSHDGTRSLAERYAKIDPRIRILPLATRAGAAHARNSAMKEARGRFIAFLDGDDMWLPQKLERQLSETLRSKAAFSYTAYKKMDAHGRVGAGVVHAPKTVTYEGLLKTCVVGCLTAMYDTWRIGKVYMPNIARRQDYALWLRILRGASDEPANSELDSTASLANVPPVTLGIDEPLAVYREHGQGISSNKLRAAYYQWLVYRRCESLSVMASLYYFAHYSFYGYRKLRVR